MDTPKGRVLGDVFSTSASYGQAATFKGTWVGVHRRQQDWHETVRSSDARSWRGITKAGSQPRDRTVVGEGIISCFCMSAEHCIPISVFYTPAVVRDA